MLLQLGIFPVATPREAEYLLQGHQMLFDLKKEIEKQHHILLVSLLHQPFQLLRLPQPLEQHQRYYREQIALREQPAGTASVLPRLTANQGQVG